MGGDGNSTLIGGAGNDSIYGGTGNDVIYGGSGRYFIEARSGNDTIYGGAGTEAVGGVYPVIHAGSGHDVIIDSSVATARPTIIPRPPRSTGSRSPRRCRSR